ncbi:hypothetical protein DH2020_009948 [Rehmannia glutinosa]|uniref:Glycosyl transferase CAP10 domain-containing protein n=1 Tax=Rehmannia glutinosa TaxID=99300 RepID=A0ABR0XA34_REHGL
MVERANKTANFRLVVLDGRAYLETYEKSFQTRDVFTLWGILQLLRRYPGKVPDLDMMFDCVDWPVIKASDYQGPHAPKPPPLFRYCGDDQTLDIVFPDWSYWGWVETNIKPWEKLLAELNEGNKRVGWMDREPYAYWKGNPQVAEKRMELLKCNVSEKHDWNARVYAQDWVKESQQGYKQSSLASQCIHRYKIYIEGSAWSVSEKYILACDSVTLMKINADPLNLLLIGAMDTRARYKPTIPPNAVELCSETMACPAEGLVKKFMFDSMVMGPSDVNPCSMPPAFEPFALEQYLDRKLYSIKQVEKWEQKYRDVVQDQRS